jgi:aldehyde:ferredoxin oxidoreductase
MCCGNICLVKSGKYTGTVVEGPEYETCAMLGPNLGVDNFAAILSATRLCDELGIDTISTGSIVGATIEGYEKGILSLSDLDGREIAWGDEDAILELIQKIAHRQGIGDSVTSLLMALTVLSRTGPKWTKSSSRSRALSSRPMTAVPAFPWVWPMLPQT